MMFPLKKQGKCGILNDTFFISIRQPADFMNKALFRKAFIISMPVLAGYLALGSAFGVLFSQLHISFFWAPFMSLTIYGGSMQICGVPMLQEHLPLLEILFLSIVINIRHIVYGLSLIEAFRGGGWRTLYLIFSLTDETYALLTTLKLPEGADRYKFMMTVSALNHLYWIVGGMIGAAAGSLLNFNAKGIEFSMTAIFVAILTDLVREKKNRIPAVVGGAATILARVLFSTKTMLPPAMLAVLVILLVIRGKLSKMFPEFMEKAS